MKKIVRLTESELVKLVKKVLDEQANSANVNKPSEAYQKMIDGAANWGTDPKDIVDGINMLSSADEFYQMNDMFKDGKTGYKSFQDMIRGEFEYNFGGIGQPNDNAADSNIKDINKIIEKLKSWGIKYNWGKSNTYGEFTIPPKPSPQPLSSNASSDWDKVKNYLLTKGFPPDFPDKGESDPYNENRVSLYGRDNVGLTFYNDDRHSVRVSFWKGNDNYRRRKWSWDGEKPVIEGGYQKLGVTKNPSGYAKTEDDILTKNKILGLGSQGDLVKQIQWAVYFNWDIGQPGGCNTSKIKDVDKWKTCDGIYGKKTKELVKKIQNRLKLKGRDGTVGKETWDALID